MPRRVVAAAILCTFVCVARIAAQAPPAQAPPPQTFRTAVELIAVDVQVVDRRGVPVAGLGADRFEVTVDGRRRRVVSAAFIDERANETTDTPAARVDPQPATRGGAIAPSGRVVILAVDAGSFEVSAAHSVAMAARSLIDQLRPTDRVGLFTFPLGPKIEPTLDRSAIHRALATVTGQRDAAPDGEFHLRPSELLDLGQWAELQLGPGNDLALKICGENLGNSDVLQCRGRLSATVRGSTMSAEGDAHAALGMLESLFRGLTTAAGRKTVVLVSAGRLASDLPGTRPNLDDLATRLGKAAAAANIAIYTLFIDQSWVEQYRAEARRANVTQTSMSRDSAVLGRWLDLFSGSAGGSLLRVAAGDGTSTFARIATELSAYYLLGVEPSESDRDGRAHEIQVKVNQRDVHVRGRSWVLVPRRTLPADPPVGGAPTAPAVSPVVSAPSVMEPPRRPAPERVARLTAAYERTDYAALYQAIGAEPALANVIREFRAADSPWPAAPRRTAVFALELALGAVAQPNGFAADEAFKLLIETSSKIRQTAPDDAFECGWYLTAAAGLQGLWRTEAADLLVTRARQRCPRESRFVLARAVIGEQRARMMWRQAGPDLRGSTPIAAEVLRLYDAAIALPDTEHEARVRTAWLTLRTDPSRALALLDGVAHPSSDPAVRYLSDLVRGQTLRALGRSDAAAAAYRAALAAWPGAQSARVALMTLQLAGGGLEEAWQLADAVLHAADDQVDPWWTYDQGDFRLFRALRGVLREVVR